MSWLLRGAQSALFYYASCTPCLERRHKAKRRKEAAKTRKEREILITEQPDLALAFQYKPVAFETNKCWAEEIAAGPGPPKGWRGHETMKKAYLKAQQQQRDASPERSPPSSPFSSSSPSHPLPYQPPLTRLDDPIIPPIVALPRSRQEVASWIKRPPPSADIMMGRAPPADPEDDFPAPQRPLGAYIRPSSSLHPRSLHTPPASRQASALAPATSNEKNLPRRLPPPLQLHPPSDSDTDSASETSCSPISIDTPPPSAAAVLGNYAIDDSPQWDFLVAAVGPELFPAKYPYQSHADRAGQGRWTDGAY